MKIFVIYTTHLSTFERVCTQKYSFIAKYEEPTVVKFTKNCLAQFLDIQIMINPSTVPIYRQIPLIHVVHEDDALLSASPGAEWYNLLKNLPWEPYHRIAVDYYDALYHFNKTHGDKEKAIDVNETEEAAKHRLLFGRATMNEDTPVLFEEDFITDQLPTVSPSMIAPGKTPDRLGGRKPKCFFALFKSFIGTSLMGFESTPEKVHLLLTSNLSFARVCEFVPKKCPDDSYWFKNVPSIRKLEQFDQIMTDYGLWHQCKITDVIENIKQGVIKKENVLVGDTTHYHAYSGFETVTHIDEKGKENRKSQSKTTKNCRCEDRSNCDHPWELADDGAG
ncbi:MAG: hypothetical protein V2B19_15540, partial [Pseudomonadota bacterium]